MIIEIGILTAAIFLGLTALGFSRLFHKNSKQNRELIEFLGRQVENLEESLSDSNKKLETSHKRVVDQSRRVAWLESRVRQPRISQNEVLDAAVLSAAPKTNIANRRQQILAMAARGENSKAIASTLGMMPGEVELIINLNRATA